MRGFLLVAPRAAYGADAAGVGRDALDDEAQQLRREVLPWRWRVIAERGGRNRLHPKSDPQNQLPL
jgi:hypothetical protein